MISKRDVVRMVLEGKEPPYVPWSIWLTSSFAEKLRQANRIDNVEQYLQNHMLALGNLNTYFDDLGEGVYRDIYGVAWNRTVDKDIGVVVNCALPEATLKHYQFPDPYQKRLLDNIPGKINAFPDRFRVFHIDFSLYERAWSLRGMENLMMDFFDNPSFVHELFNEIANFNLAMIDQAVKYDIDAVYFGDDWGQQGGLQMGYGIWSEFIKPVIKRMYDAVHRHGKYVFIHSCGNVAELFDDLIGVGLNCFNPFQPEVMDTKAILDKYRGRLTFFGGISTQQVLPCGSVEEVKEHTRQMLEAGKNGSYIISPAHAVEDDVPVENFNAMLELFTEQMDYVHNRLVLNIAAT